MRRKKKAPKIDRGEQAYWIRWTTRWTWAKIAQSIKFSSHRGALKAAKKYAMKNNLPWPMSAMSKGDAAYRARRIGMSWKVIGKRFNLKVNTIRRIAYKHAEYYNRPWPPEKTNEQRKERPQVQQANREQQGRMG